MTFSLTIDTDTGPLLLRPLHAALRLRTDAAKRYKGGQSDSGHMEDVDGGREKVPPVAGAGADGGRLPRGPIRGWDSRRGYGREGRRLITVTPLLTQPLRSLNGEIYGQMRGAKLLGWKNRPIPRRIIRLRACHGDTSSTSRGLRPGNQGPTQGPAWPYQGRIRTGL